MEFLHAPHTKLLAVENTLGDFTLTTVPLNSMRVPISSYGKKPHVLSVFAMKIKELHLLAEALEIFETKH